MSIFAEPQKEKDMAVYYNDVDYTLTIFVNEKPAITMKLHPKAFGIKKSKSKTQET
jgi:hypothetical protein